MKSQAVNLLRWIWLLGQLVGETLQSIPHSQPQTPSYRHLSQKSKYFNKNFHPPDPCPINFSWYSIRKNGTMMNTLGLKILRKNQSCCHLGWGPALFLLTNLHSWSLVIIPWCLFLSIFFYSESFYNFTVKKIAFCGTFFAPRWW